MGPIDCGKSAMTVRYLTRRYIGEYDPNIGTLPKSEFTRNAKYFSADFFCDPSAEDTYSKMITMDGDNILLRIMDTSDQVNKYERHYP